MPKNVHSAILIILFEELSLIRCSISAETIGITMSNVRS